MKELVPADYVTVSIDPKPMRSSVKSKTSALDTRAVQGEVQRIIYSLRDTGVTIKLNSILRAAGYGLIGYTLSYGLGMFADLKILDTENTLENDGLFLQEMPPTILTVARAAGPKAIAALRKEIPNTELLCVGVPTSMDDAECLIANGMTVAEAQTGLVTFAEEAGLNGVVCAGSEIEMMRKHARKPLEYSAVAIRPEGVRIEKDDQNPERVVTPTEAILRGARRVIIGRPVWQARSPLDATKRIIDEVAAALEKRTLVAA